jgi:hypothetical protein
MATLGFSAVARMARPKRVPLTNQVSAAKATTVTTKIITCVGVITAPPTGKGSLGNKVGKDL